MNLQIEPNTLCLGLQANYVVEIILKRFRLNSAEAILSNVLIMGCLGMSIFFSKHLIISLVKGLFLLLKLCEHKLTLDEILIN